MRGKRFAVFFTLDTFDDLNKFVKERYGEGRRARSVTIEQAVREYLAAQRATAPAEVR